MKANKNQKIDLTHWVVRVKEIPFNKKPDSLDAGWRPESGPLDISFEKHNKFKNKLYPFLFFLYANLIPENHESLLANPKKVSECPQEIQDLFIKFYSDGMNSVILNASIIAKPHNLKKAKFGFSVNELTLKPVTPIKDYPKPHEFALEYFWVKNKIYEPSFKIAQEGEYYDYSPFNEDWCALFLVMWQNYCQIENYLIMDNIKFMNYVETAINLMGDCIEKPLISMTESQFNKRLPCLTSINHPVDYEHMGMLSSRWSKHLPLNQKMVYLYRILDAKDYLNKFFKQYNYISMKNALELFLIKLYESFGKELISRRLLSKCLLCDDYFVFKKAKKFCSLRSEGKDCGKRARNKKYYSTKGRQRLPEYRKNTKELRAFYKERGIKK